MQVEDGVTWMFKIQWSFKNRKTCRVNRKKYGDMLSIFKTYVNIGLWYLCPGGVRYGDVRCAVQVCVCACGCGVRTSSCAM